MNKLRLLDAMRIILIISAIPFGSQAASILQGNKTYQLSIRTGTSCFHNGAINSCAETTSVAQYSDNGLSLPDPVSGNPLGSSIAGDGWAIVLQFTTDTSGENFGVHSFNQDGFEMLPYISPPNAVAFATDASQMFGSIDNAGNMIFTPVTRQAYMAAFPSFGVQDFMFDDSSQIDNPSNSWISLTTGTSTSQNKTASGGGDFHSITGIPFSPDGSGGFDGLLVSAGNYGDAWSIASGQAYVEIWDAHISTVVPIPAAVWLFSSGLLGLIGISRCKKVAK